jgi:ribonuclease E
MRLWENVRELTLKSTAPSLVYEEGSLIKRSIRDLYNKDIERNRCSGEEGYREAKDFMKMLMPSHAKVVQLWRDLQPIFARSGIEAQLDRMLQPQRDAEIGRLHHHQPDRGAGRDRRQLGQARRANTHRGHCAADQPGSRREVARQLRLRDLAGLIVIDFIDMEENRNNRAVERS